MKDPHPQPDKLQQILALRFGLSAFRPHQAAVCAAVVAGQDVLLVMPTGAGKSLCYQLPGAALAGTTLVISPLIALIDDQVARLKSRGFRAAGLHGGMDRSLLRDVSARYLSGTLDFLFVAPERFAVPRFPEMLLKRRPSLIAVDEAHCISQWGHDFRPDYRLLGERLTDFRPAPVIAMTATATPDVQQDIVNQLHLKNELRSIHGFWRSNLALEVVEASPDEREEMVAKILADPELRPAIVYAPTRKKAELLAADLKSDCRAAHYHAGLEPAERERVQSQFLAGRIEVIVATVAFGMGIDKADVRCVIHSALPGSVESYYQEIGRAGRDGKLAHALLLCSRADEQTQLYFHKLNYPEVAVLERVLAKVPVTSDQCEEKTTTAELLGASLKLEPAEFQAALQRLIAQGAVIANPLGALSRGRHSWRADYLALRKHKLAQIAGMTRFAEGKRCRMSALVRYFGDVEDSENFKEKCGHCDICAPDNRSFLPEADGRQENLIARILFVLHQMDHSGSASLFKTAVPDALVDRRVFDHVLGVMEREGWVRLDSETFSKDGKEIAFVKVQITARGSQQAKRVQPDLKIWVEDKSSRESTRKPRWERDYDDWRD